MVAFKLAAKANKGEQQEGQIQKDIPILYQILPN
jgi:hypothetical protein